MAHSCPDCGLVCYCGGDLDDCQFDGTPEQDTCIHCADRLNDDDWNDIYDYTYDGEFMACEICWCSEFQACPGGCSWSDYFARRGRAVCTSCDVIAIGLEANMGALQLWRAGQLLEVRSWQP